MLTDYILDLAAKGYDVYFQNLNFARGYTLTITVSKDNYAIRQHFNFEDFRDIDVDRRDILLMDILKDMVNEWIDERSM